MPNDCNNTLIISGPAKDVASFDRNFRAINMSFSGWTGEAKRTSKEELDSYKYWRINDEGELTCLESMLISDGYSFSNFIPKLIEDFLNGWYRWNVRNWGTKWDLYELRIDEDVRDEVILTANTKPDKEVSMEYSFQTAWSPPEPVIVAMSEQFPTLYITHSYYEDGIRYAGKVEYEDGEAVSRERSNSGDYEEFKRDVLGFEYHTCPNCNQLLEDWEYEMDDHVCYVD